jgi:antitoxin component YwqK of YwqJK toxin-antitoxin module
VKFPNDSIQEVIYYDLPITSDSTGIKEIYFDNGKLQAKGNYKNGKRTGKWVCYRRNGKLEWRTDYQDGKENGTTECFMENGSWRKMTVINGCKNGPTTEFNTDSTGRQVYVYGQYKDCKEVGLWTWKNKEQKLLAKEFYNNGKPDKLYENYFDNEKVKTRAFLRVGFVDSLQTFDSLGKLTETKYYKESTWTHE